jgi:ubiquinone/menaquinone biosynthesis C-methylase UbiE
MEPMADWNTFARVNAAQRWRKPSAMMGRPMTEALVAEAHIVPHLRVLDVASGTGEPAISIATAMEGTGAVTASDISTEPLSVGGQRAGERKLKNIRFTLADVHALPFPDDSFHRVTCRLGVMFFKDLSKALSEMYRVLVNGGRVSLLAWGSMQQPYFETMIGTVLRVCPELAVPKTGMFKFGARGVLGRALAEAGFEEINERPCEVAWNWPGTPEDLWAYFQEVTVPFKPLFQAIPAQKRLEVDQAVVRELNLRYDGSEVKFQAQITLVSAVK